MKVKHDQYRRRREQETPIDKKKINTKICAQEMIELQKMLEMSQESLTGFYKSQKNLERKMKMSDPLQKRVSPREEKLKND